MGDRAAQIPEEVGVFYLGREHDLASGKAGDAPVLYDAKDLTTHAVCIGMTGSGKTGLGVALIEEAIIDAIPVIAIDPKGDLGDLLLTFPNLAPSDFRPWIDEQAAARHGRTPDEEAGEVAKQWRDGLAAWGQGPERIARFADAGQRTIYTPGSRAGVPLSVLRSLAAPPAALLADDEALRDRVQGAVSALLGLLGVKADPLRSAPHILLATLLERAWREGKDLDLATLIARVQRPPLERVGVMDLESFMPASERRDLAMTINNLVASPGFAAWTEGEPLEVAKLLHDAAGRPRLSIVSIAHLSDAERMYVVTALLNEVVSWMRLQPGTSSLRALLYMDEVAGYLPPSAMPPSKGPMLTLLKQARAFGLGVVLATQNPVDLDYKALGNAGTWWLGRLQTEQDKQRVIDGLLSAAPSALDKGRLETILSGLGARVFLMSNAHEDAPVVFQTRWALSYLAGPLTREQIARLRPQMENAAASGEPAKLRSRPVLPPNVNEVFLRASDSPSESASDASAAAPVYEARLLASLALHYVDARAKIDEWQHRWLMAPIPGDPAESPWGEATEIASPRLDPEPAAGATFADPPAAASNAAAYDRWAKMLASHAYRALPLSRWTAPALKLMATADEGEEAFRTRAHTAWREQREADVEKVRAAYAPKIARVRERLQRAQQQVDVQDAQAKASTVNSVVSVGAALLGAVFGKRLSASRAESAGRSVTRTMRERGDIGRAAERAESVQSELDALERRCQEEIDALTAVAASAPEIQEVAVAPRKLDLQVERFVIGWVPRTRLG